jgi:predicted Rossmann fold flavoprotein
MNADVIELAVVGGGAAGLACASAASRLGVSAVVLERMAEPGLKLAITGGRKGNFTHELGPREMAERFDCDSRWLVPLLRRFPYQRIVRFFHGLGIDSRVDEEGCVWPIRTDAAGLRDALLAEIRRNGGRMRACSGVADLRAGGGGEPWRLRLDGGGEVRARRVCIATGGASYPRTGSTGSGLGLARSLGLATVDWFPALASLETSDNLRELAGVTQPLVAMELLVDGEVVRAARGHFLFAHNYVSGSSVLNLCGFGARALAERRRVELRVDWVPDINRETLAAELASGRIEHPKRQFVTFLVRYVPRRLAQVLAVKAEVQPDRLMAYLARDEAERAVAILKATLFGITGTEPMERATATGGGVALGEVDNVTLEAKRLPGLFFAGEVIDAWGETGGYNLHFAWATGIAVAEAASGRKLD